MRWSCSLLLAGILAGCGSRPTPAGYAGDDARDFVREHRAELQAEIDAGSGPRLYDLAVIAGCQDFPALGRRLHKQRDQLFAPMEAAAPGAAGSGAAAPGAAAPGAPPSDAEVAERVVRFMSENSRSSTGTLDSGELRCLDLEIGRQSMSAAGTRHIGPQRPPTTARGGTP